MIDPTLLITISRTELTLTDLVFSGRLDGTALGITEYKSPDYRMRNAYATSDHFHGAERTASALEQSSLLYKWIRVGATTEAQIQTSRNEVAAALRQSAYTVTTQLSGAPAEVWDADPGTLTLVGTRELTSMRHLVPVYAVEIPVYPIPGSA